MICSVAHGRCAERAVSQAFGMLFKPHSHSQSRLRPESTASVEFTKCRVANSALVYHVIGEDETSLMLCGTNETCQQDPASKQKHAPSVIQRTSAVVLCLQHC